MTSKNFFESLESIAYERGLDINAVLEKVETAIAIACRDTEYKGDIKMETDFEKKKIKIVDHRYVVSELTEGNKGEILLEEAQLIKPKIKVGQEIKTEVKLEKFGRKSASKFKQALLSGLKELEREEAYVFFSGKVGEILNAKVITTNDAFVTFDIGKNCEANMPVSEGLPNETFIPGEEKKVYISRVDKSTKGPKVFLSRTNKEIVKRLFEITIPEIADGSIEIMGISRDPGSRTKIGVLALKPNLDPKGACVGQGGLRIKSINEVLNNEKIDIFTWKDDPVELIAEALLPAKSLSVIPDTKTKKALVIVRDDQYSLAIGRSGQNARLAAYAVDWKIDIKKLSDATKEGIKFSYNVIQK